VGVVIGEVEDSVYDDEVEGLRGEGEVFDLFEAEFFSREVGDRLRFDVDGGDVVALTDQVVDVTAFAAAGVEDLHAGLYAATKHLIDEVDVCIAELSLELGHAFSECNSIWG